MCKRRYEKETQQSSTLKLHQIALKSMQESRKIWYGDLEANWLQIISKIILPTLAKSSSIQKFFYLEAVALV